MLDVQSDCYSCKQCISDKILCALFTAKSYKTYYLDDDYSVEPPELMIVDVFSPIAFDQEILNANIPSLDILLG